jgi:TonB family protein
VIEEVTSIGIVPAGIEHAEVTVTRPKSAIPELQESALPRYPSAARDFGIQGKVVVEVTVQAGRVKRAKVQSGDRMLSGETVRTIESWRFKEGSDAVFTTTFIYNLEVRRVGADRNARLDLRLPLLVEITATAGGW